MDRRELELMMTGPTRGGRVHGALASPRLRVSLLSTSVLAPMLLLLIPMSHRSEPFCDIGPWALVLVTIGFLIAEPLVFNIEARNEAVSFSPTDIPLAIGMLLLSPLSLVAARIVGSAILLVAYRRQPLFKFTLNLTAFTAETLIAIAVFRALQDVGADPGPWMWLSLIAALMLGLTIAGAIIAVAISFFEGDFRERVRKEFSHSYLFYLPGALLGASAAIPVLIEPWLVFVFLLPAPMVWLVLRSHGALMHRFTDLSHVFNFSSQVGQSTHLHEIADTAIDEIADQLRANTVALVVWAEDEGALRAVHGNSELGAVLPDSAGDPTWAAVEGEGAQLLDSAHLDGPLRARLEELGLQQVLVTTLFGEGQPIGLVLVADRQGAATRFNRDDEGRLQKIAEQLGVALRKGQLHVQIQHDATHDRLTGLPNRLYFEAWAAPILDSPATEAAMLLIDLDRFKEVNDTLGHHAGDTLLIQVAERVAGCLAEGDVVARFGGDEFAILVPNAGEHEASLLAETISQALERPFLLGESTVAIASSIGISLAPEHGRDTDGLVRRADLAMYDAKRRHNRSMVYRPSLEGNDSVRLAMLGDLRESLNDGSLHVEFQPKTDLRSGATVGMEALARWDHPVHGTVAPDVFIPIAEQAGLIEELTDLVLLRSLEAVRHWRNLGHEIGVAVNLSPISLVNESLPRNVAEKLDAAGVPANLLTLEITEQSVLADTPRTTRLLGLLDEIGVKISIDDFGTGHSSLTNLRKLPISELKIDRSFVGDMLVERHDEVIVKSTIDLGHNLGFTVVAEGVETDDVRRRLEALGCDIAQGFGLCRPLPLDKLDRWLEGASTRIAELSD